MKAKVLESKYKRNGDLVITSESSPVSQKFPRRYLDDSARPWIHYDAGKVRQVEDEVMPGLEKDLKKRHLIQYPGKQSLRRSIYNERGEILVYLNPEDKNKEENKRGLGLLVVNLDGKLGKDNVLIGITSSQHIREDKSKLGFDVSYYIPLQYLNSKHNFESRRRIEERLSQDGFSDISKYMEKQDKEAINALKYLGFEIKDLNKPVDIRMIINAVNALKKAGFDPKAEKPGRIYDARLK